MVDGPVFLCSLGCSLQINAYLCHRETTGKKFVMNRDMKLLTAEVENKMAHPHQPAGYVGQWFSAFFRHRTEYKKISLSRVWSLITKKNGLSVEAKNRIALLAGFQSWDDFMGAFKGDADAQINYEDESTGTLLKKNIKKK